MTLRLRGNSATPAAPALLPPVILASSILYIILPRSSALTAPHALHPYKTAQKRNAPAKYFHKNNRLIHPVGRPPLSGA